MVAPSHTACREQQQYGNGRGPNNGEVPYQRRYRRFLFGFHAWTPFSPHTRVYANCVPKLHFRSSEYVQPTKETTESQNNKAAILPALLFLSKETSGGLPFLSHYRM